MQILNPRKDHNYTISQYNFVQNPKDDGVKVSHVQNTHKVIHESHTFVACVQLVKHPCALTVHLQSTFSCSVNAEYIDRWSLDCLFIPPHNITAAPQVGLSAAPHLSVFSVFHPSFSPSSSCPLTLLGLLCANVIQHFLISIIRSGGGATWKTHAY